MPRSNSAFNLLSVALVASILCLGLACTRGLQSGQEIVFTALKEGGAEAGEFGDGKLEVYVVNSDGSGLARVSSALSGESDVFPTWSPDGRQIAFIRNGSGGFVIVMDADGSRQRYVVALAPLGDNVLKDSGVQLTRGQSLEWSPKGTHLAFTVFTGGALPNRSQLFVVNADGSDLVRVAHVIEDSFPTWSPDGERVAFVRRTCVNGGQACDVFSNESQLVVVNRDGSDERIIVEHEDMLPFPAWSPDGDVLAILLSEAQGTFIHAVAVDGSGERRLTDGDAAFAGIAWSPDGTRIAYVSESDGWGINVLQADGSGSLRLNATTGRLAGLDIPAWSPNGTRLAVRLLLGDKRDTSVLDSRGDIYVINADGTGLSAITKDYLAFCCVSWSDVTLEEGR